MTQVAVNWCSSHNGFPIDGAIAGVGVESHTIHTRFALHKFKTCNILGISIKGEYIYPKLYSTT